MSWGLRTVAAAAASPRRLPRHRRPLLQGAPCRLCSQRSSTDDDAPPPSRPSRRRRRGDFAADWNATLAGHPQTVLAAFLAAQSTTWVGLYASLSAAGLALPPSLAAGFAVSKLSKKFRQPANAAGAAILVRAFPTLGEVKVTPLVTGFVMGDEDKANLAKQIDRNAPSMTPILDRASRGVKWLEGPIDRYGLSYYLSSRASGVATIGASACLVHRGVDVGAYLSDWGIGEAVGEAFGTAAAAAMGNVCFLPLHFYAAVYGVRGLEGTLRAAARGVVDGKREAERDFRREYYGREGKGSGEGSEEESRESEYERISDGTMRLATLFLLSYSLMVSLYSFRLFSEKAVASELNDDGDEVRKGRDSTNNSNEP